MTRLQVVISVLAIALVVSAAEPAKAENVLRWASATEALTFDPHSVNHTPTTGANLQVYEPLVEFNSQYEIEASLAIRWKLIDTTTWQSTAPRCAVP